MSLYDAFISYSHAKDKPIAAALQSAIQKLGKPWYRRRALRLFRDDTSLSATPHLWPTIELALGQSSHFLLLASPEAAASKWVNREVAYWLDHNSIDTLLIGLTDGELTWDEAAGDFLPSGTKTLPPALASKFPSEPKWVDLRPYREGADKRDARFTEASADFAAAIRGMPKEDLLSQEVRQQRRALTLAWSAAALLLVLTAAATAAGVLAYREQREAVAQRDRAERTLEAATDTANSLVFDLAQKFRDAVGIPKTLIKDILDRARALQEQLIKSGQVTPDLEYDEAAALSGASVALLDINETADALSAAQQEQQIMAGLTARFPTDTNYQRHLAVAGLDIGNVQAVQGDAAAALKSYRDSFAISDRLAKAAPGDPILQGDLAASYQKIGDIQFGQHDFSAALSSYRDMLRVMNALAKAQPTDGTTQNNLALAYLKVGDALLPQGDLPGALKSFRDGLAVLEPLVTANTGNALWQFNLAQINERIGRVLIAQNDIAGALQSFNAKRNIIERLANSDPGNAGWQADLSVAYYNVGDVQMAQGDSSSALKSYSDSLNILTALVGVDPNNTLWLRDRVVALSRVGNAQQALGDIPAALKSEQDSVDDMLRLAQSSPQNSGWQRDLSIAYNKLGDIQIAATDLSDALKSYRDGVAVTQMLLASADDNVQFKSDLQYVTARIGSLAYYLVLARNFATALDAAEQATSLAPTTIWLYSNRAHALMFLGRTNEARALYLKFRNEQDAHDGKSWQTLILDDFVEFRKAGLTDPLMDEIQTSFSAPG